MATIIKPDGTRTTVTPKDGRAFGLEELYGHIGCTCVQCIELPDGRSMWLDDEGKFKDGLKTNSTATSLLSLAGGIDGGEVVGTVLLMTQEENQADKQDAV